jgi:hypothetical protein
MKLLSHGLHSRDAVTVANPEHSPHGHFTLYFYGAVLRLLAQAGSHFGTSEAAEERLPFLAGYLDEMAAHGLNGLSFGDAHARWHDRIDQWETACKSRLPLRELRKRTGLTHDDLILLAEFGLPDEDSRFGFAFGAMLGGGERRATASLLAAGWSGHATFDVRQSSQRLEVFGLLEPVGAETGELRPSPQVWNAVRTGAASQGHSDAHHIECANLPTLEALVLPPALRDECSRIPGAISCGVAGAVIIRGLRHNGRGTLAAAIAQRIGKGVLQVDSIPEPRDRRWRSAAALACLLDAAIVTTGESGPSEAYALPEFPAGLTTLLVTLGSAGGITGSLADKAITLRLPVPDPAARERLWKTSLGTSSGGLSRLRITTGNIVRAARVARARAHMQGDDAPLVETELRAALRALERPGLEVLARRVDTPSDWSHLSVPAETFAELNALEARCRQRERLGGFVGAALSGLGPGVRALFKGPSGTGKTLAARMLAGTLGMDMYRVDLAAVVNKYIGETEKNLEKVFERAEELDIVLLLDEGDALLTQRTGVQTANDRYANLETNYLLQRLESYDGILVVTTNAGDRIDTAFQRRMDVVIDFPLPDAPERWAIWQLHLPVSHNIDDGLMNAAVQRCVFSGGQIRNVALHASLLAMECDAPVQPAHLINAIEREYRKQGAVSPLRARYAAH